MTCKEAQGLIMPYINDQLDVKQLEQFLEHIEACSDCKEELEVYFTLLTGMKQLDEDKNLSGNLHAAFEKSLHKSMERIRKARLGYVRKKIVYVILCIVCCILFNKQDDIGLDSKTEIKPPMHSRYMFKYYYFSNKHTKLNDVVMKHYTDMMEYSIEHNSEHILTFDQGILGVIDTDNNQYDEPNNGSSNKNKTTQEKTTNDLQDKDKNEKDDANK